MGDQGLVVGLYTCVRNGCNRAATEGSPLCGIHHAEEVEFPAKLREAERVMKEKVHQVQQAEKNADRNPVESDALHLLKQAVRRLENGDKVNAERYVASACVMMGVSVILSEP